MPGADLRRRATPRVTELSRPEKPPSPATLASLEQDRRGGAALARDADRPAAVGLRVGDRGGQASRCRRRTSRRRRRRRHRRGRSAAGSRCSTTGWCRPGRRCRPSAPGGRTKPCAEPPAEPPKPPLGGANAAGPPKPRRRAGAAPPPGPPNAALAGAAGRERPVGGVTDRLGRPGGRRRQQRRQRDRHDRCAQRAATACTASSTADPPADRDHERLGPRELARSGCPSTTSSVTTPAPIASGARIRGGAPSPARRTGRQHLARPPRRSAAP